MPENDQPQPPVQKPSDIFSQVLLAEYLRLQEHVAHEREARDTRVNWYTLIIAGVVAGYGALSGQFVQSITDTDLRAFAATLGVAFLLTVGWWVFEAAQRFNLNAIAGLLQMQRIRRVFAKVEPELDRQLLWTQQPDLGHKRSSWIPAITVTINSFLVCLIVAIFVRNRLVDPYWQVISVLAGCFAAVGQSLYARVRYNKLLGRVGEAQASGSIALSEGHTPREAPKS